ncbi:MAG: RHS repeat-associated core domain-containing protein [Acidiferrobacterales bacterium]
MNLVYNRARYYSPTTGRFVSSDPMGLQGGLNTYAYVDNNPLRYSDPTGLCLEDGCIVETIAAGGAVGGTAAFIGTLAGGGNLNAAVDAIPGGAVGGATAVTTVLTAGATALGAAAATIFDVATTAAIDTWTAGGTLNQPASQNSPSTGAGNVCPP